MPRLQPSNAIYRPCDVPCSLTPILGLCSGRSFFLECPYSFLHISKFYPCFKGQFQLLTPTKPSPPHLSELTSPNLHSLLTASLFIFGRKLGLQPSTFLSSTLGASRPCWWLLAPTEKHSKLLNDGLRVIQKIMEPKEKPWRLQTV